MIERLDEIENATYQYLQILLQVDEVKNIKEFPWDIGIIRDVLESVEKTLSERGISICDPYVEMEEHKSRLCTMESCGCPDCACPHEQWEEDYEGD